MADMGKDKGVLADLTSISKMLGTILTQIKDIKKEASSAAGATSKVTSTNTGARGPKTNSGSGSSSLGMGEFSSPAEVTAMQGGRVNPTFGGEAPVAQPEVIAPKTTGPKRAGTGMSRASTALGIGIAVFDAAAVIGKAAFGAMPDVQETIQRRAQYYQAGITQGNRFSNSMMQNTAFRNGLYATGQSGEITNYLSQSGVNFSTDPNSSFGQKSRAISNAVQYLNMDPMAATQALTSLNSGAGSASMLRNFGIYTSDPRTGKEYSQQQIFEQLHQRLSSGRGKASVEDVNTSFYRGNLGETLRQSGLDEGTIEMYRQYEIAKAQGINIDMSNPADVKKLQDQATKAGNENPMSSLYKINTSQEGLKSNYENDYITGIKTAADHIVILNDTLKLVPPELKQLNGYLATLAGNTGTAAVLAGITGLIGVVGNFVTSLMTGKWVKDLIGTILNPKGTPPAPAPKGPKTSPNTAPKGPKGSPRTGSPKSLPPTGKVPGVKTPSPLKAAGKALPFVSGALEAIPSAANAWETSAQGGDMWSAISGNFNAMDLGAAMAVGAGTGALIGAPAFGVGAVAGAVAGGAIGGLTYLFGNVGGSMLGFGAQHAFGGVDSRVGTGSTSPTGSKPSFIMPAPGPITDGYGPRSAEATGGLGSRDHKGIDIGRSSGTDVVASAAGTVTNAGWSDAVGNNITIDHGSGYVTRYFHLSQLGTSVGARVQQGQRIAASGATGAQWFGAHLHFRVE